MMQDEPNLSLFEVSTRLGVSPSAIKKRVAQLGLPVQRGARGKLIFDRKAYALLVEADRLLKAGHGFEDCRRELGLGGALPAALSVVPDLTESPEPVTVEAMEPVTEEAVEPVTGEAESPVGALEPQGVEPVAAPEPTPAPPANADVRPLPPPVFLQLGRKRPAPAISPDLMARLDAALKMLEDKERHNQMLQSKLLVAYDEMTKLSATAAAFQERSLNLAHEVQKLQGELKMLEAPAKRRPWWKFW